MIFFIFLPKQLKFIINLAYAGIELKKSREKFCNFRIDEGMVGHRNSSGKYVIFRLEFLL